jgi:hypothetical protein
MDKNKIQPKLVEKTTREDAKAADEPRVEETTRESRRRMRRRMRRVSL